MNAEIAGFYHQLEGFGLPIRYAHNQGDAMPEELNQWTYNDRLSEMAGCPKVPQWRRDLQLLLRNSIFLRPETFRDVWTDEEHAAFATAANSCDKLLDQHQNLQRDNKTSHSLEV